MNEDRTHPVYHAPPARPNDCRMEGCVLWRDHAGAHTSQPYYPKWLRTRLENPDPYLCCGHLAGHDGPHATEEGYDRAERIGQAITDIVVYELLGKRFGNGISIDVCDDLAQRLIEAVARK